MSQQTSVPAEQQAKAPKDLLNIANFLRSSKSNIKIRVGALNGKRTDYFKGKSAIKALLSPAYAKLKNVPKVESEEDASKVLLSLIPYAFFLRVERGAPSGNSSNSPKVLTVLPQQSFAADGYFAWLYEGSQWTTYVGAAGMAVVMLACVMFPLWPVSMRIGVWYLSMGALGLVGLFFAIAIVRLIFYIITVLVVSPGIWIFPKLFADVGFVESFIPVWEWDIPPPKKSRKSKEKAPKKDKGITNSASSTAIAAEGGEDESGEGSSRPVSRGARIEEVPDEE